MNNPLTFEWDAPIDPVERKACLTKLAGEVIRRRLQTPMIWMLEIHKPLLSIGGQLAIAFWPFLSSFLTGGVEELRKWSSIMREPGACDELIEMIEHTKEEPNSGACER